VPCCTNRPYDHIHPPKVDTCEGYAPTEVAADFAYDGCPTCQSTGDEPCVTAGGRVKESLHAKRTVTETETEEEDESEIDK